MRSIGQERLTDRVGNTPLIGLERLPARMGTDPAVSILIKAEWFNPGGSVKDRAALRIIEDALADGRLRPGMTIMDATSGNTGIAYAMIGASRGFPVTLVLPGSCSEERKRILHAYGVNLILSDPYEGSDGAIILARKMAAEDPERYFYADQYSSPSNLFAHYDGTGPEILAQTNGEITHFVACLGTSGTMMGTGRRLKEYNPSIQLVAVQPDDQFHGLEGLKHMDSSIVPAIYDPSLIDRFVEVQTEESYDMARRLAQEEGLFVGQSAGAAVLAAIRIGQVLDKGVVVVLVPDGGDKYLSTALWRPDDQPEH